MISYGYAEVRDDDRTYLLIPSLERIERIGTPKQIVDIWNDLVFSAQNGYFGKITYINAMKVINSCADEDMYHIFGSFTIGKGNKVKWALGKSDPRKALILAVHLLKHGMCGDSKEQKGQGKPITEFKATEYVSAACRLFNYSPSVAKKMTMTELLTMINDKNDSESDTPTPEEHREQMSWLEKINAIRDKRDG